MRKRILLLLTLMLFAGAAQAADLVGTVITADGAPVSHATVYVHNAAPKKGVAAKNKFDYPDCAKSVESDAKGAFVISSVDASLNFSLLILADGYRPLMLKKVNPAGGEIQARLVITPKDFGENQPLRGRVIDASGQPVVGATLRPYGCKDATQRWWGGTSEQCEQQTFTDTKGEFLLLTKKPDLQLDIRVWPRQGAPKNQPLLPTGDAVSEIAITSGASVTGHVMKDGQPLPGVAVRLCQRDRGVEHNVDDFDAITDDSGAFTFNHVMPNDQYFVYATMKSLRDKGSMKICETTTAGDESTSDAGDLVVEPGNTIRGQFVCSNGKPVPDTLKVILSRWDSSDSVDVPVDKQGKFEVKNLAPDLYGLWVRDEAYHLSADNVSYEPANASLLLGRIDDNIDEMRVQLDPGKDEVRSANSGKWQTLRQSQMSGVK